MLDRLPQEILDLIVDFLPLDNDRRAINLVSWPLHNATVHHLYRTLTFSARSEWALNVLDTKAFIEARSESKRSEHLKCVRGLQFTAPFRVARCHRCSYRTAFLYDQHLGDKQGIDHRMFHGDFLCDMLDQIRLIFDELKIESLRSFRWHMGTCLPAHILDEDGYLTICQRKIQDLSLRIDAACPHAGLRLGGLTSMSNLLSLSWECISTVEELDLVQKCIEQNAQHLRILALVFTHLPTIGGSTRGFMGAIGRLFSMHTLSLTRFQFEPDAHSALSMLLAHLQSLTLRDCPDQLAVLGVLSQLHVPLQLRHFEISFDEAYEPGSYKNSHPLMAFLSSFSTLEHLHVLASNALSPGHHLQLIEYHPFLKCFVYHTRNLLSAGRSLPEETQYVPVHLFEYVRTTLCRSSIQNLGLCLSPSTARAVLEPITPTLHIKILHLRLGGYEHLLCHFPRIVLSKIGYSKSGAVDLPDDHLSSDSEYAEEDLVMAQDVQSLDPPYYHDCPAMDLIDFADWAFGPHGIKTLETIAYGDFSCGDRYSQQQVILVRDTCSRFATAAGDHPYRIASTLSNEVPDDVQETIVACPLEYLMDSDNESWPL